MENLSIISTNPILTLSSSSSNPRNFLTNQCFNFPIQPQNPNGSLFISKPRSKTILFAFSTRNSRRRSSFNNGNNDKNVGEVELFASTSTTQETTSVGVNPPPSVPPPSQFGSPLFWIGVGVGFSALFSFAASWLKKYAMQQAYKTMMGQMGAQNNQFSNTAFPSGSPFGFPPPSSSGPSTFPSFSYQPPSTSQPSTSTGTAGSAYNPTSTSGPRTSNGSPSTAQPKVTPQSTAASTTMDVSANKPEVTESVVSEEKATKSEEKQSAFVDISPEETSTTSPFENYDEMSSQRSSEPAKFAEVVQNGSVPKEGTSEWYQEKRKSGSLLSVETLEKMMEDPNIQKMIYPHLPEEMRNPATFKWMLQNPEYRQQLQDMLDNMGEGALDTPMMEKLKGFDLNSPEVKQQFDQIGLTPEEAMSRIMANPDVAMAFQNPKIQQAIMDCSENPMNIMKYQNDKEVMDVFNKIQELFPGSPGF